MTYREETQREIFQEANSASEQKQFSNEAFAEFTMGRTSWRDRYHRQLDEKLSKIFDGDKPLEINCGPKAQEKQNWTIAMNLQTDFGGECTIEKRTKKLQELAGQTEGKPVTIVVQASVKDEESGKYNVERFVLKDGKVQKLKSPGESNDYGADIESLVKFATQNYPSKNLGLILDSHGHGNEGLQGDSSDVSMADLKKHVQSGLKGSGHEKLDFLQYDACLMAQNGVLEVSKDLANHVVASAQPEGVTADTAAADNTNLAALLKNPDMTPAQLADFCVEQAKDVEGFDTLAHFDMTKYGAFRKSLDNFGDELSKIMADPEKEDVLRKIIHESFQYGSQFSISGIFGIFGKDNPAQSGIDLPNKPDKPPVSILELLPQLFERPFGRPHLEGIDVGSIGRNLGNGKRDLKDFAEKVIEAIDAGKLKDESNKLKEAAKQVLKDGAELTKSYFGRDKHKNLGGLSVFLPTSSTDNADAATISEAGGWRQFQQLLRKERKGK